MWGCAGQVPPDEVARATTANARTFFGLLDTEAAAAVTAAAAVARMSSQVQEKTLVGHGVPRAVAAELDSYFAEEDKAA